MTLHSSTTLTQRRRRIRHSVAERHVRRACLCVAGGLALIGAAAVPAGAHAAASEGVLAAGLPVESTVHALATGPSSSPSISADGRYVAFVSSAADLVSADTNNSADVFVQDRRSHVTRRVSVGPHGRQGDGSSDEAAISADGRYVAFVSEASNLVPGDTNGVADVFVRDRKLHVTRRVSVGRHGRQANDFSVWPSLSANGRYVAFASDATHLVTGDTNRVIDVFVRDRKHHVTSRVSVGRHGRQANGFSLPSSLSANGRYIAFISYASNLVPGGADTPEDVFVRDRQRHVTQPISITTLGRLASGEAEHVSISADGRFVTFATYARLVPGDDDSNFDVYLRDRKTHTTQRITASSGIQPDYFDSYSPSLSANGRYVVFASIAPDLVAGDVNHRADAFVWDRLTHVTELVSVSTDGVQGDGPSAHPSISADGRFVAFESEAANLAPIDHDGTADVFVRDRTNGVTALVSRGGALP